MYSINMKRLFIIIATIVVVIGVAAALYFFVLAPKDGTLTVGNPFSDTSSGNISPSSDLPTDGMLTNAGTQLAPRFVKITDGPVARGSVAFGVQIPIEGGGAVNLGTTTASSTTVTPAAKPDVEVRFIDRASGNVYAYVAKERTLTRISNKTLPGIQRASWAPDGTQAFAQFLAATGGDEQVNTYALTARGGDGYLLESGLAQAHVIGSSTLFTLFSGSTGSVGTLSRMDGSNSRTLFSSVLSALTVHGTSGNLFATNKPSSELDGYAFQIDRTSGSFSRILGPFRGLSVLPSANGRSLIYSYTSGGAYSLRTLDVATRSSTALPVATLTEKCVWSASGLAIYCAVPTNLSGNQPDSWYQGATVFTDRIWKIDLIDRTATLVLDPEEIGKVSVDAVNLTVDPLEDFLVFTDKHTGALYSFDL